MIRGPGLISCGGALLLAAALLWAPACSRTDFTGLGSAEDPVEVRLMPSAERGAAERLAAALRTFFRERQTLHLNVRTSQDFSDVATAMGRGQVHAALFNTFGYLLAHKWGDAEAVLCLRFGSGRSYYEGRIVVRADSPLRRPADLAGKTIAFKDRYATSGYVLPTLWLREQGIEPGQTVFAGSYLSVVQGVFDGRYDAGAIYFDTPAAGDVPRDARKELYERRSDTTGSLRLLAPTGRIKSSPLALAARLPQPLKRQLTEGFEEFAQGDEGLRLLAAAYDATGLERTSDADYAELSAQIERAGLQPELLVRGGVGLLIQEKLNQARLD